MDELKNRLSDLIRTVAEGDENVLDVVNEVLPDGVTKTSLAFGRRQLLPEPPRPRVREESPRRNHAFHSAASLAAYLARYKTENTVVLADASERVIVACLDEKAVGGFETVVCVPMVHPLFEPWGTLLSTRRLRILELASFIMANRRSVFTPDGRWLALMFSQIRASSKVEVKKGIGPRAINGIMVTTEVQGQTQTDPIDLPETITIKAPLYVGLEPVEVELDLLVGVTRRDDDYEVVVEVTSSDYTSKRVAAFEAMVATLQAEGMVVGLGSIETQPWAYLPEQTRVSNNSGR